VGVKKKGLKKGKAYEVPMCQSRKNDHTKNVGDVESDIEGKLKTKPPPSLVQGNGDVAAAALKIEGEPKEKHQRG